MAQIELSEEKSNEQADLMAMLNRMVSSPQFDWDYLKEAQKQIDIEQSNFDTLAAVHGQWSAAKSDLRRQRSKALKLLIDYVESLKKCNELQAKVEAEDALKNMFGF